ncbi:DgyrCDS4308 [Dimorphilus gyrociliatus]|uniref:Caveolin n=1 Tax=Dimorphilus gyrociliatus TaxID=2664684 RepID=A0A7I8VJ81_9ANNE|nr:DgyrCDS4308 [Dimorphilus gyrociliatus]
MGLGDAWSADPDLNSRDPNELNNHLAVTYEDVIGEPDHLHSIDCVWRFSYKCFNLWKTLCYLIMSTICGIPMAIYWGCLFSCIAFCHIWEITPMFKLFEINVSCYKRFYGLLIHCCLDPICEAVGLCFSAFKK